MLHLCFSLLCGHRMVQHDFTQMLLRGLVGKSGLYIGDGKGFADDGLDLVTLQIGNKGLLLFAVASEYGFDGNLFGEHQADGERAVYAT